MSITCISCHQATRQLNPAQAEITQQPESGEWGIDLILACPHCGQQYGAWVLNWDIHPLTGMTAKTTSTPIPPCHQTHEGNKQ
ncbi:hypothetical protein CBG25_07155 [Arsenophonus sp. ENCA]|uniref:hypothetical protein n=1 Tax=Arsenophonus sp. ENCA TaxID=1987579 RepID=UPI000BD50075|nr:hypothetical protein [Arsenophonus sp. ENCA]PAV04611.1 hypothetical protein CBG25_07155 [Arsenophonus sp. ENCA]